MLSFHILVSGIQLDSPWFTRNVPLLQVVFGCSEVKKEDPTSKMLLSATEQEKREVETRHRSVKLLEQCIMIAKRTWGLGSLHFPGTIA